MKFIKKSVAFAVCMIMFVCSGLNFNTFIANAAGVPDNDVPVYSNADDGGISGDVYNEYLDKTKDVFDAEGFTGEDETGLSTTFSYYIQLVVKFIINLCVYTFAGFLTLMCVVDAICIPFPIVAQFFATRLPIQLFSNECAEVTGYSYSSNSKSSESGGMNAGSSNSGSDNSSVGEKYKTYVKKRAVALIFSGLLMTVTYTGLLSVLLTKVVAFLASILGRL